MWLSKERNIGNHAAPCIMASSGWGQAASASKPSQLLRALPPHPSLLLLSAIMLPSAHASHGLLLAPSSIPDTLPAHPSEDHRGTRRPFAHCCGLPKGHKEGVRPTPSAQPGLKSALWAAWFPSLSLRIPFRSVPPLGSLPGTLTSKCHPRFPTLIL